MVDYYKTPEYLRLAASINRRYAHRCMETYAKTGRDSALSQAHLHEACAAIKERQAADAEKI